MRSRKNVAHLQTDRLYAHFHFSEGRKIQVPVNKLANNQIERNPKTPETEVTIPKRVTVKFKPGLIMKNKVAKLKARNLQ